MDIVVGHGKNRTIKRVLTKEGKAYKAETTAYIVQNYPTALSYFKPNKPYGYIVQLCLPNLLNSTWPDKAQTRYKKTDATNRAKLFEDALAEACGIDDSTFLSTRYDKAPGGPTTKVWLWCMEEGGTSP
jgi:hypothetical protein